MAVTTTATVALSATAFAQSAVRVSAIVHVPFQVRTAAQSTARIAPIVNIRVGSAAVAESAARGAVTVKVPLSGRASSASSSRAVRLAQALFGRTLSKSSARGSVSALTVVQGRVSAQSKSRGSLAGAKIPLTGRIRANSSALAFVPYPVPLVGGRVTAISRAQLLVHGRALAARAQTAASLAAPNLSPSFQHATIRATSSLALRGFGELLSVAAIRTNAYVSTKGLTFRTLLNGQITTTTVARFTPTQSLLSGRILAASFSAIQPLPILPEIVPPYCPVPAFIDDYLSRITSEHNQRPNYMQTVTSSVQSFVDDQALVSSFPCLFDLDVSVGQQEDYTGQWVGKTRYVNLGDVFFSWDIPGLGWDQANWRGPFDPPSSLARLDDYHYRLLLYATIVANHWDGSVPKAYEAWDTLFAHTGYKVVIQDYGNMTMLFGLMGTGIIDAVTQALFENGNMNLKPEGISLIDYVFQAVPGVPFFAWDSNSDSVNGWDTGYWGILVPPGQGFVPDQNIVVMAARTSVTSGARGHLVAALSGRIKAASSGRI